MNDINDQEPAPDIANQAIRQHLKPYDRQTKRVFEHPAMVKDFLVWRYGPALTESLDLSRLTDSSAEYIAADGATRLVDSAWLVPAKAGDKSLVVLFEFQWNVDPEMTKRVHEVEGLAVKKAQRRSDSAEARPPVSVLSVVLYLGPGKWTAKQSFMEAGITASFIEEIDRLQPTGRYDVVELAALPPSELECLDNFFVALARLMRCDDRSDALRELCALDALWRALGERSLGKEIADLAVVVLMGRGFVDLAKDLRDLLRDARITDRRLEKMVKESDIFPQFMAKEVAQRDAARREGRAEGRAEGSVEGGRNVLVGQCRLIYGEDCASSLADLLQPVDSLDVLNEVSRGLVERGSADEFLARVKARV